MHPKTFALLLTLVAVACDPTPRGPAETVTLPPPPSADSAMSDSMRSGRVADRSSMEWHVSASDRSFLVFGSGDTLRMHASELRYVTQLTSPLGKPWFLFSGIETGSSDRLRTLYVVSPGDSLSQAVQNSWHMPGRLMDSTGTATYYEASVFAGEVLRDTVGVIWYDRSLMPDGQWRLNTTLLQLGRPEPDTIILFGQGRKSATIDLAVKGKCRSLTPIDQRTASH